MDIRSIREAAFISRFIHIVFLAAMIALGVHFRSRVLILVLTAAWFLLFIALYAWIKPHRHRAPADCTKINREGGLNPNSSRSGCAPRYYIAMRLFTLTLAVAVAGSMLFAKSEKAKTDERLDDSASLFSEVMGTPDKAIPQNLLDKAACIVLVPGLKKGAFVIGGKYGRGFAVCRHGAGSGWGAPAAIRVEGGSFGFQIGVSSTDVILLIMNERGMKRLTTSKFTIGGEATAAAGPVGRDATAQTDALLTAEILSWSRSRGLFAGISLDGATLRNDIDENEAMYGQRWDNKQILMSGAKPPAAAGKLLAELNKYSPRETH